jgi:hypothetical protein
MTQEKIVVGWTHAICDDCFNHRKPGHHPVRVKDPDREQCCDCGRPTTSGIYIRDDPMMVRYPRPKQIGGE